MKSLYNLTELQRHTHTPRYITIENVFILFLDYTLLSPYIYSLQRKYTFLLKLKKKYIYFITYATNVCS